MNNSDKSTGFIRKAVSVRKRLIRTKKSLKPQGRMLSIINKMERQLNFYGRVTPNYLRKHADEIIELLPRNRAGEAMMDELHQIQAA